MTDAFTHDVFLSHSSKDKNVVRPLAERLRADGVRVWFDEWEIKPGDSIPAKIEQVLERSRVLVLCMSAGQGGGQLIVTEGYCPLFLLHRLNEHHHGIHKPPYSIVSQLSTRLSLIAPIEEKSRVELTPQNPQIAGDGNIL